MTPGLVSIGWRNSSPASGQHRRRFVCLRGVRHRSRPVERHHEQARMIEHVNAYAGDGQSTHGAAQALTGRRVLGEQCVQISPRNEGAA
jgi:hypothetical protein